MYKKKNDITIRISTTRIVFNQQIYSHNKLLFLKVVKITLIDVFLIIAILCKRLDVRILLEMKIEAEHIEEAFTAFEDFPRIFSCFKKPDKFGFVIRKD